MHAGVLQLMKTHSFMRVGRLCMSVLRRSVAHAQGKARHASAVTCGVVGAVHCMVATLPGRARCMAGAAQLSMG